CKAAMARSGSPMRAATRARISIGMGPTNASFSIGFTTMACSDRANAAALSRRPTLVRARSYKGIIVRRLFEQRFQFVARLRPSFLGDGMIAGHVLGP